jgi:hypothetical protein
MSTKRMKKRVILVALIIISLLAVSSGIRVATGFNNKNNDENNNQISAVGVNKMDVNRRFTSTLRFSP